MKITRMHVQFVDQWLHSNRFFATASKQQNELYIRLHEMIIILMMVLCFSPFANNKHVEEIPRHVVALLPVHVCVFFLLLLFTWCLTALACAMNIFMQYTHTIYIYCMDIMWYTYKIAARSYLKMQYSFQRQTKIITAMAASKHKIWRCFLCYTF